MRYTGQFVKLVGECDGEEEELVANCDKEGDGEVVVIEDMDGFPHCFLWESVRRGQ